MLEMTCGVVKESLRFNPSLPRRVVRNNRSSVHGLGETGGVLGLVSHAL